MTIISNHRVHSYKASASLRHRDISPKKVCIKHTSPNRKYHSKQASNVFTTEPTIDSTKVLSSLLSILTNTVSTFQYKVLMPPEYHYEEEDDTTDTMTLDDDDMEEAWAYYDYLEYLYD
jgi:hypothetical protein